MVAGAAVTAGKNTIGLPGCPTSCGGVSVPYPLGIEPGCSLGRQPWFKLTCNTSYAPPVLFLHDHGGGPVEVLDISLDDSTLRVAGYRFIGGAPPLGLYLLGDRMLEWGVVSRVLQAPNETRAGNATCPQDLGTTACHSSYSTCQAIARRSSSITGYVCRCDDGYQGNPYLSEGCQGYVSPLSYSLCFKL
jgi:hypothetical protein